MPQTAFLYEMNGNFGFVHLQKCLRRVGTAAARTAQRERESATHSPSLSSLAILSLRGQGGDRSLGLSFWTEKRCALVWLGMDDVVEAWPPPAMCASFGEGGASL